MLTKFECHTNLDLRNEEWPTEMDLPRVPLVGEKIDSKRKHGNFRLSLEVVAVRWRYVEGSFDRSGYVAEVELHQRMGKSIREFYGWYAPLVGSSVSAFI